MNAFLNFFSFDEIPCLLCAIVFLLWRVVFQWYEPADFEFLYIIYVRGVQIKCGCESTFFIYFSPEPCSNNCW